MWIDEKWLFVVLAVLAIGVVGRAIERKQWDAFFKKVLPPRDD
jgi:hypothetical protein